MQGVADATRSKAPLRAMTSRLEVAMPLPNMLSLSIIMLCCVCAGIVRFVLTVSEEQHIHINGMVSNNATFNIYIQYVNLCSQTMKLELLLEER